MIKMKIFFFRAIIFLILFSGCASEVISPIEDIVINSKDIRCGSCGNNSICKYGRCKCLSGYKDCDGWWNNGCEINLSSVNSCGTDCSNIKNCELIIKNVTKVLCHNYICDYEACIYPYEDRDADRTNGCEYVNYFPKKYGGSHEDRAYSIQQTSDGGFVVAGYTTSFSAGISDFWVIRLDSNGDVIWQKAYGGIYWDEAYSIQQTSDGGFIVAGSTESLDRDHNFLVIRLDSNGDIIWQRRYGRSFYDHSTSIYQTLDGGFIVAGWSYFVVSDIDFWIIKIDSEGRLIGNCGKIEKTSSATVTNTNLKLVNSSASVTNTNATIQNTTSTPKKSNLTAQMQCTEP
jgi:hypothetical protein